MSKIANKGTNSMNGILAPKKSEANGNMLANGTANGTSSPLFDTVQVDSRVWKRDNMNGTGTPRRFEFINEEEEEDDDEK